MSGLAAFWRSPDRRYVLWRSTVALCILDVLFTGLVGAYAFTEGGVASVLALLVAQQVMLILGYWAGNQLLQQPVWSALHVQRLGLVSLATVIFVAGSGPWSSTLVLALLALGGGVSRGIAYCARQWMEVQIKDSGERQRYLSSVEALHTMVKVGVPLTVVALLSWQPGEVRFVFTWAGLLFLALLGLRVKDQFDAPVAAPTQVMEQWKTAAFWRPAPYFLTEGSAHALRMALFVSGAMAIVGSVKAFSFLEGISSLLAATFLLMLSRRRLTGASYRLLAIALLVMGVGWASLIGALYWPWLLPVFVVLQSLSMPLVNSQKMGFTITGIVQAQGSRETNLFSRTVLLGVARVTILLVFLVLSLTDIDAAWTLKAMAAGILLLLPLEYWTARRFMQPKPPASP